MDIGRSAWAEIDLDNLKHNLSEVKRSIPEKTRIMGVVKANAYGHGAIQVAKALRSEGVNLFAVALVSEALELRNAGLTEDIMILGYTPHELFREAISRGVILTVYNREGAEAISEEAKSLGRVAKVHVKIDTGMGRLGFRAGEKAVEEIVSLKDLENLELDGFFTHFATSDERDKSYSATQFKKFSDILDELRSRGVEVKNTHVSNSGAIIDLQEYTLDIVRPGIMLYGYYPSDEVSRSKIKLREVMTLKTRISNIKQIEPGESVGYGRSYVAERVTKVATVPLGYGDGFTRLLSGKLSLSVGRKRAKLIGNICMDQSMIDCTDIEEAKIGDEVIAFGYGSDVNNADSLAKALGTISYEILCMVGMRIPRVYTSGGKLLEIADYLQ
ncbi:alanine racemase [Andreesenia angusta]|uniref:Alanine racemase n=2 Tax=Andreesenia angusta TaxID=39480 RepID=A0A1S1V5Z3_9FIRM|nr:alanine racemase [Andreesenia angusta]